jgi:hypothetical protein
MWRERVRGARKAARTAGAHVHKVAAQSLNHARLSGAKLARKVVAIQQAAGLNWKLAERSLRSVQSHQGGRESDQAFRQAYTTVASAALQPQPEPGPRAPTMRPLPDRQPAQPSAGREAGG